MSRNIIAEIAPAIRALSTSVKPTIAKQFAIRSKVAIYGAGAVGSEIAAFLVRTSKNPLDIVFCNRSVGVAEGVAADIMDGTGNTEHLFRSTRIGKNAQEKHTINSSSDEKIISGAELVILAFGMSAAKYGFTDRKSGLPLVDNLIKSAGKAIATHAKDAFVLVITNPVDISTELARRATGFPSNRVIGSGTEIDSRRFCRLLRERLGKIGINPNSISAKVVGAHSGDDMIMLENSLKINSMSIKKFLEAYEEKVEVKDAIVLAIQDAKEAMKNEGFKIAGLKKIGPSYGPAICVGAMALALLGGNKIYYTGSYSIQDNENWLGFKNAVLSIPLVMEKGKVSIDHNFKYNPTREEMARLEGVAFNHQAALEELEKMPKTMTEQVAGMVSQLDQTNSIYQARASRLEREMQEIALRKNEMFKYFINIIENSPSEAFEINQRNDSASTMRIKVLDKIPDIFQKDCVEAMVKNLEKVISNDEIKVSEDNKSIVIPNTKKIKEHIQKIGLIKNEPDNFYHHQHV